MSCSSAGPRGPAVIMLVLSATGAPASLVKRFVSDIGNFLESYESRCGADVSSRARQRRGSRGRNYRAGMRNPCRQARRR